jgi:hypothetical protein
MSQVRLPRSLKAGPFDIKVDVSKKAQERVDRDTEGPLYGMWDGKSATILLSTRAADTIMRETLVHEILHAVLELSGASSVHIKDSDEEEGIVRSIAPMLLDVLRRNPKLVDYLRS